MKEVPAGVVEMAKDKWNKEIESLATRAYETDWAAERAKWTDWTIGLFGSLKTVSKEASERK
jgi:MICOS complex subunit MIC12